MKAKRRLGTVALIALAGAGALWARADADPTPREARAARADGEPGPRLRDLMRSELEGVAGREVIVSVVEMPPGLSLPWHRHPGEEFVYVLRGAGVVHLRGGPDASLSAGDVFKVPFEAVHAATAGSEGLEALVFRVHSTGRPERILVEGEPGP